MVIHVVSHKRSTFTFLLQYEEIIRPLELTDEDYRNVMKVMNHHMKLGLGVDTNDQADIKMFVTYVRDVPTGKGKCQS